MGELTLDDLREEELKGAQALRDDLSTISCFAALRIQMLIIGQNPPLEDVQRLVSKIDSWTSKVGDPTAPKSLFEYNTVLAMTSALPNCQPQGDPAPAAVEGAKNMRKLLASIAEDPAQFRKLPEGKQQLVQARNFCSRLSHSVQAMVDPPDLEQVLRESLKMETEK